MEKDQSPLSVQEMIERYNRELMAFKERHAAARPAEVPASAPASARLNTDFPLPDITRDLEALRQQQAITDNSNQTEQQLELEPGEMETPPGVDLPRTGNREPVQNMTEPAQPSGGTPPFPISPTEQETASNASGQDMSLGYLRVAVTTGRGTIPVQNAQVIVTRVVDGNELLEQADRTNSSGITPLFTLPAVSSIYSQSPGNGNPYTYYTVYVRANGFYPVQLKEVPLYGGITSIQPVELTPVAEGGDPNRETTITEGAPENL